jgi:tryptophan-rich sensory protein
MTPWYHELAKPPLNPPDWIFAPVWTVLYIMIAVAIVLFFTARGKKHLWLGLAATLINLAANFLWTPLFFACKTSRWLWWISLSWTFRLSSWCVYIGRPAGGPHGSCGRIWPGGCLPRT